MELEVAPAPKLMPILNGSWLRLRTCYRQVRKQLREESSV
jgi:hypothetical protein